VKREGTIVDDLFDFAFFPRKEGRQEWLEWLAERAVTEHWGKEDRHLLTYCRVNFKLSARQGEVFEDPDKKFAVWRVGHLTRQDGSPLYFLCERNRLEGKQPYVFKAILAGKKVVVRLPGVGVEGELIEPAPKPPTYEIPPYEPSYSLECNWDHLLDEHATRINQILPFAGANKRIQRVCVQGAAVLAHSLWQRTSVPQFHEGHYGYLLPLYITHENYSKPPDAVAPLVTDVEAETYKIATLQPPDWAYGNARAIATNISQFSSWAESGESEE
jgi:hypothetical protein